MNLLKEESFSRYFRIKDNCPVNIWDYYAVNGTLPFEYLDEITENELFDGSGKTISYGASREQIEAILSSRKQELLTPKQYK